MASTYAVPGCFSIYREPVSNKTRIHRSKLTIFPPTMLARTLIEIPIELLDQTSVLSE